MTNRSPRASKDQLVASSVQEGRRSPTGRHDSLDRGRMPKVHAPYRIGEHGGDFDAAPETLSTAQAERLLGYLQSAECLVAAPGWIEDPFAPDHTRSGVRIGVMTDGEWVWPLAWHDYVNWYRAAPPSDFMDHVQAHGWVAPPLSEDRISAVMRRLGMPDEFDE
ncbi:hypothetical protein [Nocardia sp. NPDC020380]|uniref:hypothetical protein n=1 Tax=Nocardia sp. NPDC020380 TaxID=3364309 RepID=UPI00379D4315